MRRMWLGREIVLAGLFPLAGPIGLTFFSGHSLVTGGVIG